MHIALQPVRICVDNHPVRKSVQIPAGTIVQGVAKVHVRDPLQALVVNVLKGVPDLVLVDAAMLVPQPVNRAAGEVVRILVTQLAKIIAKASAKAHVLGDVPLVAKETAQDPVPIYVLHVRIYAQPPHTMHRLQYNLQR